MHRILDYKQHMEGFLRQFDPDTGDWTCIDSQDTHHWYSETGRGMVIAIRAYTDALVYSWNH